MGRKSKKQLLASQEKSFLTVKELIEVLSKFPEDAPVGTIGHFGEFYPYHRIDFSYSEQRETYITPSDSWRDENRKYINVVEISQTDIGEEPN